MMRHAKAKAPLSIMEKKIPVNPRYANTQSKIDSGTTVNKVRLISNKEFLKHRDETFRRVTPKLLQELFVEYEDSPQDGGSDHPEMVAHMVKQGDGTFKMERTPAEDEEDNQGSRSCAGPRIVSHEAEEQEVYDAPYLILDMRTKEEFAVNRIHRAQSFPTAMLNRDMLLPDMHRMKNDESKLIILYDLDDKTVSHHAHTLVQRGFDNIYVLSGGMADFAEQFPDRIEGLAMPKKAVDPTKKPIAKEIYKAPSVMSTTSRTKSVHSTATKKKDSTAFEVNSVASGMSVAESVISRATARKTRLATGTASFR